MADDSQPKAPSKAWENTLNILGSVGGIAGKLIFGPDFDADLGAPFRAGAEMMRDNRMQKSLLDLFNSNPHTAPIAQGAQDLMNSGGLINHPDVQDALSGLSGGPQPNQPNLGAIPQFKTDPSLSAPVGSGGGGLMGSLNTMSPASQSPAAPQMPSPAPSNVGGQFNGNFLDPTFLKRAISAGIVTPQDMGKIIAAQAGRDPNKQALETLHEILLGKQINDFQTPEQKMAAQLQMHKDLSDYTSQNTANRQLDERKDKLSAMTQKDHDAIEAVDQSLTHMQALPDTISSLIPAGAALAKISPAAASYAMPDLARIQEGLAAAKIQFGSALKGARINKNTLDALTASFPDPGKNPELWPQMKSQVVARLQLAKLVQLSGLSQRGVTNEGLSMEHGGTPVMDPADKQDFDVWMKTFEKFGQKALSSPQFQELTQKFGLGPLFINPSVPVK